MIIYMLAAAMTVAMLIATAFGLHQESQRVRSKSAAKPVDAFAVRRIGHRRY